MDRVRVLITGFGPFPGAPFNPTGRLAQSLARLRRPAFADTARTAHIFAVTYADVDRALPELLARHRPHVLLMFGLATHARVIRIETRARNSVTSLWPDAGHRRAQRSVITPHGPGTLAFGPHIAHLAARARATHLPVRVSHDAGRYLCNYLSFRACEAARAHPQLMAAFVHVPPLAQHARPHRNGRRWHAHALLRAGESLLRVLVNEAWQRQVDARLTHAVS